MLDIQSYRHLKSLPVGSIMGEIIRNFCDKENLKLWQTGIKAPVLKINEDGTHSTEFSDSFSHYQGFAQSMVRLAQEYAQKTQPITSPSSSVTLYSEDHFAANDIEFVLNPDRIEKIIPTLLQDQTEGDRRRLFTSYLQSSMQEAKKSRTLIDKKALLK